MNMSLALHLAAITGQENADLTPDVTVATVEQLVEAQVETEVAEATAAVAVAEKDIDQLEALVESVEEKVEELEEQIDGMESMLNGKSEYNAGLFAHQFAQASKIAAKLGKTDIAVLGAESLADVSTAQLNTLAGLLSLKDTVKSGASAAKRFFISLYQSFIALIAGIFNKYKGFEGQAAALKTKLSGEIKTEGKVTPPAAAGWLDAAGKGPDAGEIIKGMETAVAGATGGDSTAVGAYLGKIKGYGKATASNAPAPGMHAFKVAINNGEVAVVIPSGPENMGKANLVVGSASAPGERDRLSKEALSKLVSEVASEAAAARNSKLTEKSLTAQRDAGIAKIEGEEDKTKGQAIKDGHSAGLRLMRGAHKLAESILGAKLALVKAHLGGGAAPAKDEKKDDKAA